MNSEATADTILTALKDYIRAEVLNDDEAALEPSTELIKQGILDSINLLRVIAFLEERFGIQVSDDDILPQNFQSLSAIRELVVRYQSRHAT